MCDHMVDWQGSFSCFIEHVCFSKISLIVNLCTPDSNFPFICGIYVDIISPMEEVSKKVLAHNYRSFLCIKI